MWKVFLHKSWSNTFVAKTRVIERYVKFCRNPLFGWRIGDFNVMWTGWDKHMFLSLMCWIFKAPACCVLDEIDRRQVFLSVLSSSNAHPLACWRMGSYARGKAHLNPFASSRVKWNLYLKCDHSLYRTIVFYAP